MDYDSFTPAGLVAAHLALVVAVIHLSLGLLNWIKWASVGFLVPRDLRWPLFVLSGLVMVAGMLAAARGRRRRPLYVGGILLMVTYVVGYFGWHLTGHRTMLLVGEGFHHHGPLVPYLIDHLFAGPVEFLAIATETALAVVLGYLLVRDSRADASE